jgi:hypothetical protein
MLAVRVGVKVRATATVAMAAAVDETVAEVSAAKRPLAKSGHPAKAVAVAKDASKAAKAKPSPLVASAQNAVSVPHARAVAMADLKPVVKTVAKRATTRARKPEPMRHQSSTPMAPKCAKNVRHVRDAVNGVSVAVKAVVSAAIGASVAKPMRLRLN